jgi:hypothetical protein
MLDVFTAFGLSASSGLNAYLPLLIVGLLSRYTDLINLSAPWNVLESPWVLAVVALLLVIEMTVDKIPAVDTLNDALQTFVRPAAGAILFASSANIITDTNPLLSVIAGLLVSGGVHASKAAFRPLVTATTGGIGNPVVSTAEDVVSGATALAAILFPLITALLLLAVLLLVLWMIFRRRRRRQLPV